MSSWPAINDIVANVSDGSISARANVETALQKIKETAEFQSIIQPVEARALERADLIDQAIAKGEKAGRLAGVPFIAKDNFLTFGSETTAASNILRGFHAPYQATAIERLEAEGAICIAKANLDAFAHGSSTENSDFFVTKNPHNQERVAGGSSGGSAAAVALEIAPFALGSDTGGSIRLPAAFCGIVGYKPSYGLVSRSGVVAMASSTDCIGPLTKTTEEAALVLDVMSGRDKLDSTTIEKDSAGYANLEGDLNGLRVGVVSEYMQDLGGDIANQINGAIEKIKDQGATVEEISLPSLPLALAVYYIICPAEVSSNLSRYDGQRYGYSSKNAATLEDSYEMSREEGFGVEAKRRIMMGTYVLSSGYYDAYYQKAQIVRTKVINEFADAFKKFDVLVGPTAPMTAFKIGEKTADPLQMYLTDIMTVAANISGNPAISIPAGISEGLPVGFQLIGDYKADRELLGIASKVEGIL